ncbi:hypothetical protein [Williamsia deligens]|uniref:Uncharacterized protein n=1 Tax=Williamsia deligens TaxID=321325 RepID=A0ABW3GC47_9NOCA|nr:hypothetical protein [Williamsia deligens]
MTAPSPATVAPRRTPSPAARCAGVVAVALAAVTLVAGCTSGSGGTGAGASERPSVSVPVSAVVTPPAGPVDRTAPGAALTFGQSAYLPANAFRPGGQIAMVTVTGIEPGVAGDVPGSLTDGGSPFYVHVTYTSLVDRVLDAPSIVGLAGSADGRTAARTVEPPDNLRQCVATETPKQLTRGTSWATCFIAVADPGVDLTRVIYWAQTTTDPGDDYKASPVVWAPAGAAAPTASATPTS